MTDKPYIDPTPTNPSEIIKLASDEYKFRVRVLEELAAARSWRDYHTEEDNRRFNEISERVGNVSSGVGDFKDAKAQVEGARKLIFGVVAIVAGIGGMVLFVLEVLRYAESHK